MTFTAKSETGASWAARMDDITLRNWTASQLYDFSSILPDSYFKYGRYMNGMDFTKISNSSSDSKADDGYQSSMFYQYHLSLRNVFSEQHEYYDKWPGLDPAAVTKDSAYWLAWNNQGYANFATWTSSSSAGDPYPTVTAKLANDMKHLRAGMFSLLTVSQVAQISHPWAIPLNYWTGQYFTGTFAPTLLSFLKKTRVDFNFNLLYRTRVIGKYSESTVHQAGIAKSRFYMDDIFNYANSGSAGQKVTYLPSSDGLNPLTGNTTNEFYPITIGNNPLFKFGYCSQPTGFADTFRVNVRTQDRVAITGIAPANWAYLGSWLDSSGNYLNIGERKLASSGINDSPWAYNFFQYFASTDGNIDDNTDTVVIHTLSAQQISYIGTKAGTISWASANRVYVKASGWAEVGVTFLSDLSGSQLALVHNLETFSNQELAALTPWQVASGFTGQNWSNLGGAQLNQFAISSSNAARNTFAYLPIAAYKGFSVAALQILDANHVAQIPLAAFDAMGIAQINAMGSRLGAIAGAGLAVHLSNSKLIDLSDNFFIGLTNADFLNGLTVSQMAQIPAARFGFLSHQVVARLEAATLSRLSNMQLAAIGNQQYLTKPDGLLLRSNAVGIDMRKLINNPLVQWSRITYYFLNQLDQTNFGLLTPEIWKQIPISVLSRLTSMQTQRLSEVVLNTLSNTQFGALKYISQISISTLKKVFTSERVNSLRPYSFWNNATVAMFNALSTKVVSIDKKVISTNVVASIPVVAISQLPVAVFSAMDALHLEAFTNSQLSNITPQQFAAIDAKNFIPYTDNEGVVHPSRILSHVSLNAFKALQSSQIRRLYEFLFNTVDKNAFENVTDEEIETNKKSFATLLGRIMDGDDGREKWLGNAVNMLMELNWLDANLVAKIDMAQIQSEKYMDINWGWMSATFLNNISADVFSALKASNVVQINLTAIASLDKEHIAALTVAQVGAEYCADGMQVAGLTPEQLSAITYIDSLSAAAVAAIRPAVLAASQINLGQRSSSFLEALTPKQYAALSGSQLAQFSSQQLITLPIDWSLIQAKALNGLSSEQFRALCSGASAKVLQLSAAALAGLDALHEVDLGIAAGSLSTSQVSTLRQQLLYGFLPEEARILLTSISNDSLQLQVLEIAMVRQLASLNPKGENQYSTALSTVLAMRSLFADGWNVGRVALLLTQLEFNIRRTDSLQAKSIPNAFYYADLFDRPLNQLVMLPLQSPVGNAGQVGSQVALYLAFIQGTFERLFMTPSYNGPDGFAQTQDPSILTAHLLQALVHFEDSQGRAPYTLYRRAEIDTIVTEAYAEAQHNLIASDGKWSSLGDGERYRQVGLVLKSKLIEHASINVLATSNQTSISAALDESTEIMANLGTVMYLVKLAQDTSTELGRKVAEVGLDTPERIRYLGVAVYKALQQVADEDREPVRFLSENLSQYLRLQLDGSPHLVSQLGRFETDLVLALKKASEGALQDHSTTSLGLNDMDGLDQDAEALFSTIQERFGMDLRTVLLENLHISAVEGRKLSLAELLHRIETQDLLTSDEPNLWKKHIVDSSAVMKSIKSNNAEFKDLGKTFKLSMELVRRFTKIFKAPDIGKVAFLNTKPSVVVQDINRYVLADLKTIQRVGLAIDSVPTKWEVAVFKGPLYAEAQVLEQNRIALKSREIGDGPVNKTIYVQEMEKLYIRTLFANNGVTVTDRQVSEMLLETFSHRFYELAGTPDNVQRYAGSTSLDKSAPLFGAESVLAKAAESALLEVYGIGKDSYVQAMGDSVVNSDASWFNLKNVDPVLYERLQTQLKTWSPDREGFLGKVVASYLKKELFERQPTFSNNPSVSKSQTAAAQLRNFFYQLSRETLVQTRKIQGFDLGQSVAELFFHRQDNILSPTRSNTSVKLPPAVEEVLLVALRQAASNGYFDEQPVAIGDSAVNLVQGNKVIEMPEVLFSRMVRLIDPEVFYNGVGVKLEPLELFNHNGNVLEAEITDLRALVKNTPPGQLANELARSQRTVEEVMKLTGSPAAAWELLSKGRQLGSAARVQYKYSSKFLATAYEQIYKGALESYLKAYPEPTAELMQGLVKALKRMSNFGGTETHTNLDGNPTSTIVVGEDLVDSIFTRGFQRDGYATPDLDTVIRNAAIMEPGLDASKIHVNGLTRGFTNAVRSVIFGNQVNKLDQLIEGFTLGLAQDYVDTVEASRRSGNAAIKVGDFMKRNLDQVFKQSLRSAGISEEFLNQCKAFGIVAQDATLENMQVWEFRGKLLGASQGLTSTQSAEVYSGEVLLNQTVKKGIEFAASANPRLATNQDLVPPLRSLRLVLLGGHAPLTHEQLSLAREVLALARRNSSQNLESAAREVIGGSRADLQQVQDAQTYAEILQEQLANKGLRVASDESNEYVPRALRRSTSTESVDFSEVFFEGMQRSRSSPELQQDVQNPLQRRVLANEPLGSGNAARRQYSQLRVLQNGNTTSKGKERDPFFFDEPQAALGTLSNDGSERDGTNQPRVIDLRRDNRFRQSLVEDLSLNIFQAGQVNQTDSELLRLSLSTWLKDSLAQRTDHVYDYLRKNGLPSELDHVLALSARVDKKLGQLFEVLLTEHPAGLMPSEQLILKEAGFIYTESGWQSAPGVDWRGVFDTLHAQADRTKNPPVWGAYAKKILQQISKYSAQRATPASDRVILETLTRQFANNLTRYTRGETQIYANSSSAPDAPPVVPSGDRSRLGKLPIRSGDLDSLSQSLDILNQSDAPELAQGSSTPRSRTFSPPQPVIDGPLLPWLDPQSLRFSLNVIQMAQAYKSGQGSLAKGRGYAGLREGIVDFLREKFGSNQAISEDLVESYYTDLVNELGEDFLAMDSRTVRTSAEPPALGTVAKNIFAGVEQVAIGLTHQQPRQLLSGLIKEVTILFLQDLPLIMNSQAAEGVYDVLETFNYCAARIRVTDSMTTAQVLNELSAAVEKANSPSGSLNKLKELVDGLKQINAASDGSSPAAQQDIQKRILQLFKNLSSEVVAKLVGMDAPEQLRNIQRTQQIIQDISQGLQSGRSGAVLNDEDGPPPLFMRNAGHLSEADYTELNVSNRAVSRRGSVVNTPSGSGSGGKGAAMGGTDKNAGRTVALPSEVTEPIYQTVSDQKGNQETLPRSGRLNAPRVELEIHAGSGSNDLIETEMRTPAPQPDTDADADNLPAGTRLHENPVEPGAPRESDVPFSASTPSTERSLVTTRANRQGEITQVLSAAPTEPAKQLQISRWTSINNKLAKSPQFIATFKVFNVILGVLNLVLGLASFGTTIFNMVKSVANRKNLTDKEFGTAMFLSCGSLASSAWSVVNSVVSLIGMQAARMVVTATVAAVKSFAESAGKILGVIGVIVGAVVAVAGLAVAAANFKDNKDRDAAIAAITYAIVQTIIAITALIITLVVLVSTGPIGWVVGVVFAILALTIPNFEAIVQAVKLAESGDQVFRQQIWGQLWVVRCYYDVAQYISAPLTQLGAAGWLDYFSGKYKKYMTKTWFDFEAMVEQKYAFLSDPSFVNRMDAVAHGINYKEISSVTEIGRQHQTLTNAFTLLVTQQELKFWSSSDYTNTVRQAYVTEYASAPVRNPVLHMATVDGDKLILHFDRPMGDLVEMLPLVEQFTVIVAGKVVVIREVAIYGNGDVVLTLPEAVTAVQMVSFSYSAPSGSNLTHVLQDRAGYRAPSIVNHSVLNLKASNQAAPTLVDAYFTSTHVRLVFDQLLDTDGSKISTGNFSVNTYLNSYIESADDTPEYLPVDIDAVLIKGNIVELELANSSNSKISVLRGNYKKWATGNRMDVTYTVAADHALKSISSYGGVKVGGFTVSNHVAGEDSAKPNQNTSVLLVCQAADFDLTRSGYVDGVSDSHSLNFAGLSKGKLSFDHGFDWTISQFAGSAGLGDDILADIQTAMSNNGNEDEVWAKADKANESKHTRYLHKTNAVGQLTYLSVSVQKLAKDSFYLDARDSLGQNYFSLDTQNTVALGGWSNNTFSLTRNQAASIWFSVQQAGFEESNMVSVSGTISDTNTLIDLDHFVHSPIVLPRASYRVYGSADGNDRVSGTSDYQAYFTSAYHSNIELWGTGAQVSVGASTTTRLHGSNGQVLLDLALWHAFGKTPAQSAAQSSGTIEGNFGASSLLNLNNTNFSEGLDGHVNFSNGVTHLPEVSAYAVRTYSAAPGAGQPSDSFGTAVEVKNVYISGNSVILTLNHAIPQGDWLGLRYSRPSGNSNVVQDLAGNAAISFSAATSGTDIKLVNRTGNDSKPEITLASVSGNSVTLRFSESLQSHAALLPPLSAFTVRVNHADVKIAAFGVVDNRVQLTLASATRKGDLVEVDYSDIKDTQDDDAGVLQSLSTGLDVASQSVRAYNVLSSTRAPALLEAAINGYLLVLNFSDQIDSTRKPANSDFIVTVNSQTISVRDAVVKDNRVLLTLGSEVLKGTLVQLAYAPGNHDHTLLGMSNRAVQAWAATTVFNQTGIDATPPLLNEARVVGNLLTLTFTEELDWATVRQSDVDLFGVSVDALFVGITSMAYGSKTITLTLNRQVGAEQLAHLSYTPANTRPPLRDLAGLELARFSQLPVNNLTRDITPPVIVSAVVNRSYLSITFSELLQLDKLPKLEHLHVKLGDQEVPLVNSSINGDVLTLSLGMEAQPNTEVTLSYAQQENSENNFQDNSGNQLVSVSKRAVLNITGKDVTRPTLLEANLRGAELVLTMTENLVSVAVNKPGLDSFVVQVNGTEVNFAPNSLVVLNNNMITLTLAQPVKTTDHVQVSYVVPTVQTQGLFDLSGNASLAFSSDAINRTPRTAPLLKAVSVDGYRVVFSADKDLDSSADGQPPASAFRVEVRTEPDAIGTTVEVSSLVIYNTTLMLTLKEPVTRGKTVLVSYTKPVAGPNDVAGKANSGAIRNIDNVNAANVAPTVVDNQTDRSLVQTITVNGDELNLVLSQPLSLRDSDRPLLDSLTVTVDGVAVPVTEPSVDSKAAPVNKPAEGDPAAPVKEVLKVNPFGLTLKLPFAVSSEQTVTLAYTNNSTIQGNVDTHRLRDFFGYEVDSFKPSKAVNITPPTINRSTPSLVQSIVDGDQIILTYNKSLAPALSQMQLHYAVNGAVDANGSPLLTGKVNARGFVNLLGSSNNGDTYDFGDQSAVPQSQRLIFSQLGNGKDNMVTYRDTTGMVLAPSVTGNATINVMPNAALTFYSTLNTNNNLQPQLKAKADQLLLYASSSLQGILNGYETIDAREPSSTVSAELGVGRHSFQFGGQSYGLVISRTDSSTTIKSPLLPYDSDQGQLLEFKQSTTSELYIGRESDGTLVLDLHTLDAAKTEHDAWIFYDGGTSNMRINAFDPRDVTRKSMLNVGKLVETLGSIGFASDTAALANKRRIADASSLQGRYMELFRVSDLVSYSLSHSA